MSGQYKENDGTNPEMNLVPIECIVLHIVWGNPMLMTVHHDTTLNPVCITPPYTNPFQFSNEYDMMVIGLPLWYQNALINIHQVTFVIHIHYYHHYHHTSKIAVGGVVHIWNLTYVLACWRRFFTAITATAKPIPANAAPTPTIANRVLSFFVNDIDAISNNLCCNGWDGSESRCMRATVV
jgi:hypothetical protein